jgi:predicted transcriptional regulator
MEANGFPIDRPGTTSVGAVLRAKPATAVLVSVSPDDSPLRAAEVMESCNISQLPVIEGDRVIGSITEATLTRMLFDGAERLPTRVAEVMGRPLPVVDAEADLAEAYRLLLAGHPGLIVAQAGRPWGIITRIDLVRYWLHGTEKGAGK